MKGSSVKSNSRVTSDSLTALIKNRDRLSFALITAADTIRRVRALAAVLGFKEDELNSRSSNELSASGLRWLSAEQFSTDLLLSIEATLRNRSIFSPQVTVVLEQVEKISGKFVDGVLRLVDLTSPEARLILIGANIEEKMPLVEAARKRDALLVIPELEGTERFRWVGKELRSAGIRLPDNQEAVERLILHLIEISEDSLDKVVAVISHLSLYLAEEPLTLQAIELLFPHRQTSKEYELVDDIAARKLGIALGRLQNILGDGVHPLILNSVFQRNFQQFLTLLEEEIGGRYVKGVGISSATPQWLREKQLRLARRFSRRELLALQKKLLRLDSVLKNKSLGAEIDLASFILDAAAVGERGRAV